jgi:hypothetical protein
MIRALTIFIPKIDIHVMIFIVLGVSTVWRDNACYGPNLQIWVICINLSSHSNISTTFLQLCPFFFWSRVNILILDK